MTRIIVAITLALALAFALTAPAALMAQDGAKKAKAASAPKVGKNQKVCRYRFPDGERRTWVCEKDQPCCAWDAIKYVKCGNTITRCL
jgi:hypothetical protein